MKMFIPEIEELEAQIEKSLTRDEVDKSADQDVLLRALRLSNEISASFEILPKSMLSASEVTNVLQRQSRMLRRICQMQRQSRRPA